MKHAKRPSVTCTKRWKCTFTVSPKTISRYQSRMQARNTLFSSELLVASESTPEIDFENGIVVHEGNEYHFPALPPEILAILEDGGLIPHVRKELGKV